MHSFKHHHHESGEASAKSTNGLIMKGGWRYDLHGWLFDTCLFGGKGRELRQRTATLAQLQPGDQVLDAVVAGCLDRDGVRWLVCDRPARPRFAAYRTCHGAGYAVGLVPAILGLVVACAHHLCHRRLACTHANCKRGCRQSG